MENKITVVITTHNEAENIKEAIESAQLLTHDILVVDTSSTDKTVSTAKKLGSRILSHPYTVYVEPTRGFAMNQVDADWVFILDADERITKELAHEILSVISDTTATHFKVARKNIFGQTRWLKYGGWYPDRIIRLIKKETFLVWPKEIHSTPQINGEKGCLKEPLIHKFHPNLENMVAKTAIFEDIESELLYKAGRKAGTLTFMRKFFGELYRRLLKWAGFLDGASGVIESIYQAYSKTVTYLMLYEKNQRKSLTS